MLFHNTVAGNDLELGKNLYAFLQHKSQGHGPNLLFCAAFLPITLARELSALLHQYSLFYYYLSAS